jgi:two-component system phosphate regulon sensor histidine kinase PhoR
MNRKVFTGLIVLMGISILGIIAVQLIWMNNAIKVKNELFNQSVTRALQQTVSKLEDIHNLGVVNEMVFAGDSGRWTQNSKSDFNFEFDIEEDVRWDVKPESLIINGKQPSKAQQPTRIIRQVNPGGNQAIIEIKVENDSGAEVQTFSYNHSAPSQNHIIIADDNNASEGVFLIKRDTITSDSLYTFSTIKIDSLLSNLDTLNFIRPDITQRIKVKATNLKRMANKVVTEMATWDVRQVNEELIFDVLKEELKQNNVPLDFEYGIIRDSIMEFPKEVIDSAKVASTAFKVRLYPNDIFQKNLQLAVFFPKRDSFIYRSLNWLLVASLLFSLFILLAFALSIFYILRQKKVSEMKSDFINNMTHEFKTPIATISVATDSITNEKVVHNPEKIKYFAGMIKKENTRMNRQVEDILTIARLDRNEFEFTWETIDVHELINDAVQGIKLQIEKRGGIINLNLDAKNPAITTDRNHCTNVIYNLLDNANKYSADAPEITLTTRNNPKGILISVADKGIGMSKSIQGKIFERFYRQTSGNIHNIKGFGLGLSYVHAVLEANKGNISVESEPGKGSKFELFLPFVRE